MLNLIDEKSGNGRRLLLTSVVVAAALALTTVVIVTGRHQGHTTALVSLTHGSYRGVSYQLQASESNGRLCLQVSGPAGAIDPAQYAGQCGFDVIRPPDSYWGGGLGPDDSYVMFGPLPADATRVRLSAGEVMSSSFPAGAGLPRGRYWIQIMPTDPPGNNPQPLDSNHHPVAFAKF